MIKKTFDYLKMDIQRGICSWKALVSACVIGILLYLSCGMNTGDMSVSSLIRYLPMEGIGGMLIWLVAAIPYSANLCNEMENRYHIPMIMRGNSTAYIISKMIAIFLSSMMTLIVGFYIFLLLCRINHVWYISSDSQDTDNFLYCNVLREGRFGMYILLVAIQIGVLAGVLSLIALFVSVFIQNQILIVTVPVLYLYIENFIFVRILGKGLGSGLSLLYSSYRSIWSMENENTAFLSYVQMMFRMIVICIMVLFAFHRRVSHE